MTTIAPPREERDVVSTTDRLSQLARIHETVSELHLLVSEMDDAIDDARLIALNAALEARRSEHGGDGFAVIAEQLNLTVDRLHGSRRDIANRVDELKRELEQSSDEPGDRVRSAY